MDPEWMCNCFPTGVFANAAPLIVAKRDNRKNSIRLPETDNGRLSKRKQECRNKAQPFTIYLNTRPDSEQIGCCKGVLPTLLDVFAH